MLENFNQMYKRHQAEIKKLQKLCNHEKTKIMMQEWAPGHFSGYVKVCDWCNKITGKITPETILTLEEKNELDKQQKILGFPEKYWWKEEK